MQDKMRILVATDTSDWAEKAENRGASLTKSLPDAEMLLVNIQEKGGLDIFASLMSYSVMIAQDTIREETEKVLIQTATKLAEENAITVTPVIRFGNAAEEIQALAEEKRASILVMGAHGQGYHSMPIIGNIPAKLIQGSPCPVLIVRDGSNTPYRRILIPIDFSEVSINQVLKSLPFLQNDAEIILMNVCETPSASRLRFANVTVEMLENYRKKVQNDALEKINELIESLDSKRKFKAHVETGIPHEAILKYIKTAEIDLLILGKQPRNRLQDYLVGSTVHYAINEAECDVLITPTGDIN